MKSRILIAIFVVATIVLAICTGAKVFEKEDVKDNVNNANINIVTSLEDKLSDNSAWCGTFNLIWNDLKNDLAKQDIEFPESSAMVDNLNKGTFTTNELSEASYYKTYGTPTLELKAEIERAIKQKFNETSDILDSFDWSGHTDKDYFLYAMLKKEFEYPKVFDKLENGTFENYNNVRYFGITGRTKEAVRKQVQVLYYNSENDFALKIQTKGNDEIIVAVGNKENNFLDIYNGIINKSESYKDWKGFRDGDTFRMPYITFNLKEEITEVENKPFYFSNGDEYVIQMALQTIQFDLDEKGGRVKSEAGIMVNESAMEPQEPRKFNVDQTFTIFLLEQDKNLPYFAAKISDISSVQSGVKTEYEISGENAIDASNKFNVKEYVNEIQEKNSKLEESKKIDITLSEEIYGKELIEFMQGMEIDEVSGTIITDEENFVTIMPMPDFLDNQSYYFENERLVAYKRDFMGIGGSVTYYFKDAKLVFIDESKIEPEMVFESEDVASILVRAANVYKSFCDVPESNNININDFYSLEAEEYAARGEEVDLLSEYDFIEKIAKENDLEISRQLKVYVSEHENQMRDEYSKFQENSVIYKFKDNRDYYVEMLFSENEILGTWKENSNNVFVDSVIENETVHLFEWKIAYDDYHNNARAQFSVNRMNFIVKAYDISHEEFIEIVGTTIKEYKSFEIQEVNTKDIPDEIKIWQMKPCTERFSYILTEDQKSYIYDYENNTYELVMDNNGINHINVLNVLKEKNKIYLEVINKDFKSSLVGIDYINYVVTSKTNLLVDAMNIVVSDDEQKITYRKEIGSLYISSLDGSNEKMLIEGISKGEDPNTTGYVPERFIDNNRILYTCIGWEQTKGCGIVDINTLENIYYENGYNAGYHYNEKENGLYTTLYGYAGYCHKGILKVDMTTGNEENIILIPEEEKSYVYICFSDEDNGLVALGKEDGNVYVYDLETKQLEKELNIENARIQSIHLIGKYIYIRYSLNNEANLYIVREKIN